MKKDHFVQPREKFPRKVKCGVIGIEEIRMVKEALKKEKVSNKKNRKRGRCDKTCEASVDPAQPVTMPNLCDENIETRTELNGISEPSAHINKENRVEKESGNKILNNSGLSHFMDLEERKDLLMTCPDDDPLSINGPEAYDAVSWVPIKEEVPDDIEVSRITITEIPLKVVEESTSSDEDVPTLPVAIEEPDDMVEDDAKYDDIENDSDSDDDSWWNRDDMRFNDSRTAVRSDRKSMLLSCDICDKKLSSKGSLRIHKKKKHDIDIKFNCELCSVNYDLQRDLIKHRNEVHRGSNGRFACKDCGKYLSNYRCFLIHIKMHCEEENVGADCFKCEECGKGFNCEESLSLHKVVTHNGKSGFSEKLKQQVKNFVCHTCGKRFAFGCLLRDHMNLHTGTKPYLCQACGRSFAQKASLKQHARTHNSVRPFLCGICDQGFFGNGDLKKHMRKHTGERPYVCDMCGDGFSQSSHLGVHRRSHTGERPFKCDVCSRGFTKKGDVVRHRRIHTGELPYLCQVCGKAFRQSTQCSNHIKIHHPEAPIIVSKNPGTVNQWIL